VDPLRNERGQASVELVALLPIIVLLAGLLWQAAIAGQTLWLAGSAARAAARAKAVDADAAAAARSVLPASLDRGVRVASRGDGGVKVTLPIRSIFSAGVLTTVDASARFEPQGGGDASR
jgi:hypothetical protein